MENQLNSPTRTIKYTKHTYEQRLTLIKLVVVDKWKTRRAAVHLGINLSTAKLIIKTYKRQGKVVESKREKAMRSRLEIQKQNKNSKKNILDHQDPPTLQSDIPCLHYVFWPYFICPNLNQQQYFFYNGNNY